MKINNKLIDKYIDRVDSVTKNYSLEKKENTRSTKQTNRPSNQSLHFKQIPLERY